MRSPALTPSAADICAAAASALLAALVQAMKWSRLRHASRTTSLKVTSAVAIAGVDAKCCGHLRRGRLGTAGRIGPGHEMVAAEARFAHDILEGNVGGRDRRR